MKIIVNNLQISYQDYGKGKIILLLHGWTGEAAKSFEGLSRELQKNYRVIMPDLPGFGQSGVPPESWGIPEYGEFIKSFTNKLELKPGYIVAHSNGGTVALYALGRRLLETDKLILLDSAGIRRKDKLNKILLKAAAKPVKLTLKVLPQAMQTKIKKQAYGKLGSDLYVMENMKPIFNRVVGYDIQSEAKKITQPTLLVYGAEDSSTPVNFGKIFASIMPTAQLEVVAHAGHYVHLDQPTKVLELIEDFLA